jgi:hypothetical protein
MPQSKNNFIVHGLSGTFEGIGTFYTRAGKTFLRKNSAERSVPDSAKQSANKQRFAEYTKYAKAAIKDPVIKAVYAKVTKPGQSAFNRAITDARKPPKIGKLKTDDYLGRPGDTIMVEASDDFKVAAVKVCIYDASGGLIEQGDAIVQINELDWLYVTTVANESFAGSTITATATNLPGNKTTFAITLS